MPIYEYQCQNCGHLFDELQTMSEVPLVKCPNCGKDELKKLIGTGAGLVFKGSGFYQTDYKNAASKPAQAGKPGKSESSTGEKTETKSSSGETKSESKSKPKSESKQESKTENKSESKTETKPAKKNK
jgi:putative FmdB family regulatory protein